MNICTNRKNCEYISNIPEEAYSPGCTKLPKNINIPI